MFDRPEVNYLRFDSTGELVRFADERIAMSPDVRANALYGDTGRVEEAQKLMEQFAAELATTFTTDEACVAGAFPIVPEALMGEPECMRMPTEQAGELAPLTIFVDLTTSGGIPAQEIMIRGTSTLALVMALSAQRPVSLEVGCAMDGRRAASGLRAGERLSVISTVIDTAPLDVATAAWYLTSADAARRLIYRLQGHRRVHNSSGGWPRLDGVPYGAPSDPKAEARMREILDLPGEALFLPAVSAYQSEDMRRQLTDPVGWIREKLEQFGK